MNEHEVMVRQERRRLRGTMLRTARTLYGQEGAAVTLESFRHVAGRHKWTLEQIREEATYLTELGFLAKQVHKRDELDRDPPTDYALTARGVKLLNGDMAEESIEL